LGISQEGRQGGLISLNALIEQRNQQQKKSFQIHRPCNKELNSTMKSYDKETLHSRQAGYPS